MARPTKQDAMTSVPVGYDRGYLMCRAMGHEWHHRTSLVKHATYYTVRGLASSCEMCGCVRTRWIYADGRRLGNSYEYPDGYQIKHPTDTDIERQPAPKPVEWRQKFVSTLGFREEASNGNVARIDSGRRAPRSA